MLLIGGKDTTNSQETARSFRCLMNRSQMNVDLMIGDFAAVFDPCRDRIAEVKPDEHARHTVFVCANGNLSRFRPFLAGTMAARSQRTVRRNSLTA
jgi:hypothetical protein